MPFLFSFCDWHAYKVLNGTFSIKVTSPLQEERLTFSTSLNRFKGEEGALTKHKPSFLLIQCF